MLIKLGIIVLCFSWCSLCVFGAKRVRAIGLESSAMSNMENNVIDSIQIINDLLKRIEHLESKMDFFSEREAIQNKQISDLFMKVRSFEALVKQDNYLKQFAETDRGNANFSPNNYDTKKGDSVDAIKTIDVELNIRSPPESDQTEKANMELPSNVQNNNARKVLSRRRRAVGQVAFSAYLTHTNSHMSPGQPIKFDQVLLNDGQAYNAYTGAFTAPLTGTYLFTFNIDSRKNTPVRLVVNGVNENDAVANPHNAQQGHSESMGGNTAILHVQHGQAVIVETYESNDSEVASSNTFRFCTFSGVLLY